MKRDDQNTKLWVYGVWVYHRVSGLVQSMKSKRLDFVECPKFRKLTFNLNDPLHRWLRFLEQGTTPEQLEEMRQVDEVMKEAESRLTYLASDEETRRRYAVREKALHDRASWLDDAERRGIEQGIQKTVLNMLGDGVDVATISKYTGFSAEQIEKLMNPTS